MLAFLTAVLVGLGVPYFLSRKSSERFPTWIGFAGSLLLGWLVGGIAIVATAFGAGWLIDQLLNFAAGMRLEIAPWIRIVIGTGVWAALIGASLGSFHGRHRAIARRRTLAGLTRMKEYRETDITQKTASSS
jgi:hypothetical protein